MHKTFVHQKEPKHKKEEEDKLEIQYSYEKIHQTPLSNLESTT